MNALDSLTEAEVTLAIIGGGPLTLEEREWASRSKRVTVEHMPAVSDAQLREEYGRSSLFVFPSRAEGFGLPVLEAMAAGTVVVTSDAAALVEAGGGHGITFHSGQADSLAAALQYALALTPAERRSRLQAAQAYAATMSWQQTALRTAGAYREFLS